MVQEKYQERLRNYTVWIYSDFLYIRNDIELKNRI